ncbi:MAG: hypothetical protein RR555_07915 [Bacteroidales bacterium]
MNKKERKVYERAAVLFALAIFIVHTAFCIRVFISWNFDSFTDILGYTGIAVGMTIFIICLAVMPYRIFKERGLL